MNPRLDYARVARQAMMAMMALESHVRQSGLEPRLLHLVRIRASQLNGCAYCIHMHTREAREHGESEDRLYLLDAWRESPLYSERELVELTVAVASINALNRLAISFRAVHPAAARAA